MKVSLAMLLIILFTFSCASKVIDQGVYKKSQLVTDHLSHSLALPWRIVQKQHTDLVLENTLTKSLFIFSSACRSFESSSLEQLSSSLITGLNDVNIKSREVINHQSREAILMSFDASLDGVTRYMKTLTTLKNFCIYDYSLISRSQEYLESDSKDFNNFTQLIILN